MPSLLVTLFRHVGQARRKARPLLTNFDNATASCKQWNDCQLEPVFLWTRRTGVTKGTLVACLYLLGITKILLVSIPSGSKTIASPGKDKGLINSGLPRRRLPDFGSIVGKRITRFSSTSSNPQWHTIVLATPSDLGAHIQLQQSRCTIRTSSNHLKLLGGSVREARFRRTRKSLTLLPLQR